MRSLLFLLLLPFALAAQETPAFPASRRNVIIWVPPYAIAKAKAALRQKYDGVEPAGALTHLALQFWTPTAEGGVREVTRFGGVSDAVAAEWRDWAHAHGVRALLCVYNGVEKWDWNLARRAFGEHRLEFVDSIAAEVERLKLDGVDLDLEGNGSFDDDKPAYLAFVTGLSETLHQKGKQLFVDSFAYIWNAPNQTWWHDLLPLVDGLNSMGYEETGARGSGWRSYAAQTAAAGEHVAKLSIGLPTHLDRWQELTALEHLEWIAKDTGPGVALWDGQLEAASWRAPGPWMILEGISRRHAP